MSSPLSDLESVSSDNGTKRRRLNEAGERRVKQEPVSEEAENGAQTQEAQRPAMRRHEQWYDQTADMEVVTTDQVLFKLHTYQLQSWSPHFRDLVERARTTGEFRIHLTDQELECSDVFTHFLHLVIGTGEIVSLEDALSLKVVRFARNRQIDQLLRMATYQLRLHANGRTDRIRFHHFKLALALEDSPTGLLVLTRSIKASQGGRLGDDARFPIDANGAFDPRALDIDDYLFFPPKLMFVMLQVSRRHTSRRMSKDDLTNMVKDFMEVLRTLEISFSLDP